VVEIQSKDWLLTSPRNPDSRLRYIKNMAGRKTSRRSKNIIKLLENGESPYSLYAHKGYPKETVRYYWRKLKYPEKYKAHIKTITKYNSNRLKLDNTQK